VDDLARRLKTSPVLAQLLLNRGLSDTDDCLAFLKPSLMALHDPGLIPNLSRASQRVARAIHEKQKIVIFGDYDVDGITGTTILWHAIRTLGGNVQYYIPHRIDEGYGLNREAVVQLCDAGAGLIITVDCGITAIEPAQAARERGVDLIISDHHEWKTAGAEVSGSGSENASAAHPSPLSAEASHLAPHLPDCYAIVHPRLPRDGPAYPNQNLCGAGVAFKLAWGIGQAVSGTRKVSDDFRSFLVEATALAALGTIADVVPLTGENRVLAHFGLGGLKQSKLLGIRALIGSAGLDGQKLDSYHVGFLLAPRLNAVGRLGHAALAVEMLTVADGPRATEIATYLEQQNRNRQATERKILESALQQIEQQGLASDDTRAIVLGGEGWHAGVIGIVASRIVDRFHRPAIMVALNNGHGQGSGRSVEGFHLARALDACTSHLVAHGGHEMAAGLKMESSKFEDFRNAFVAHANEALRPEMLVPRLELECLAQLEQISEGLVISLQRLGPFGQGNRRPVLCCRGVQLAAPPRKVGKTGDHVQLFVKQGTTSMKCIAFNFAKACADLKTGDTVDLAVEATINEFNGYRNVELEVKDLVAR